MMLLMRRIKKFTIVRKDNNMRLRNIRGAGEVVSNSEYTVKEPRDKKGSWNQVFDSENPLYIEIGMGKGKFITTLARENPNINYIGIERYTSVLVRAIEKLNQEEKLPNLRFICMDAGEIEDVFDTGEVDRIYLNFSDPWPKDRHAKRRLTSKRFLERYNKILRKDGFIEFKTDNDGLFEFSMEEIPEAGWNIVESTWDLHNSNMVEGNVMTEYEEKFSAKGNPIHKLICNR